MRKLKLYKIGKQYLISEVEIDDSKVLAEYNDISELYPNFYNATAAYDPKLFTSTSAVTDYYATTPTRTVSEAAKVRIGAANSVHQQGEGNSQYGTRWIHSLELKMSKKIRVTDPLPDGWLEGRKIKFED